MEPPINSSWKLWYHSITDNNWTKKSYNKLFDIRDLCDYKLISDTFKQNHYQNGMFFLMRNDIFPNWEDPLNRLGGCLSFKVPSNRIIENWNQLVLRCITANLLNQENDVINGISISPKKEFNIIKIWFNIDPFNYKDNFNSFGEYIKLENSIYKKHDI
tara:strand:+ start:578 stop:1054 length:477 start_codon:yes stop_codon:yes gene_type:complete